MEVNNNPIQDDKDFLAKAKNSVLVKSDNLDYKEVVKGNSFYLFIRL